MKRILSLATFALFLVFAGLPPAFATPAKGDKKEAVVLMPLRMDDMDRSMLSAMETALVQGLGAKYEVYSGENVAKKAREIFAKESRTVKKDCDETRCMQDIAMAFQAELIAVAAVTKRPDGYFLARSIRNILDEKTVFSNSLPCKGCDEYEVVDALKLLAGGEQRTDSGGRASSPSKPVISPAVPSGDFSLDDLDNQAKAEKERKADEKAKWDKYLSEMKKAFSQVESYEKKNSSKELKIAAWEKFLSSYQDDVPYGNEDKKLRDNAKGRIRYLKNSDIEELKARLKARPDDPEIIVHLGDAYFDLKQFNEAVTYYKMALTKKPNDAEIFNDLGLSVHYLGNSPEGLRYVEEGLKKNPYHQLSWLTKGFILAYGMGDLEGARAAWEKAKTLNPESQVGKAASDFLAQFNKK